jgi:hypothetical protein
VSSSPSVDPPRDGEHRASGTPLDGTHVPDRRSPPGHGNEHSGRDAPVDYDGEMMNLKEGPSAVSGVPISLPFERRPTCRIPESACFASPSGPDGSPTEGRDCGPSWRTRVDRGALKTRSWRWPPGRISLTWWCLGDLSHTGILIPGRFPEGLRVG